MSSLFRIGQVLKGRVGTYTITKEVQSTVWFAKNQLQDTVVIKGVEGHPRVENEPDVLKRFQYRTPYLRPLIDEIQEPSAPTTIALRYLESDLWEESNKTKMSRKELKHVSRCILEALKVLHEDGYVHTDVKPDNVFVNLQEGNMRFSDVQLGDLGGCYPDDSKWATGGIMTGTAIWASPEVLMELPWNTASDIWAFGTLLISLIYGRHVNPFVPKDSKPGDEDYNVEVFFQQYRFFAPFPAKFQEIVSLEIPALISNMMEMIPPEQWTPFCRITNREMIEKDKNFIGKMMKLDWRDRPTAKELLEDEWWKDDEAERLQLMASEEARLRHSQHE